MKEPQIGERVKVQVKHWARAGQYGVIEDINEKGSYLIRFERKGVGFNEGTYLFLTVRDFDIIDPLPPLINSNNDFKT
jgi:hypothetical protein